ncbi:hypothetical protein F8M41_010601 [Gigaspora margarita]|uniref:Uncharacterized protein n=1 Tax=Gigaspora margarita TaxID=4874 RepID=A0A8H4EV52_GIGMA|nr:hypothetical protein F8M41_010601 [Gigaspora margarita]
MILEQSLLLETLKTFCPNLKYFHILDVKFSTQLLDFIGNLKKLQFLSLGWHVEMFEEEILNLAKILPFSLQYLDLYYIPLNSNFDIFLNAPLRKLLIGGHIYKEKYLKG